MTVVRSDGLDTEEVSVLLARCVEVLSLLHGRVKVVPVPSGVAELLPSVDLVTRRSVPDEEVESRRTTEDLSTGPARRRDTVLSDSGVVPVELGTEIGTKLTRDVNDAGVEARSTGLKDTDLVLAVLGETSGKSKTGGTGTDDDVVVLLGGELGSIVGDGTSGEVRVFSHASGHLAARGDLGPCDRRSSHGASQGGGGDQCCGLHYVLLGSGCGVPCEGGMESGKRNLYTTRSMK